MKKILILSALILIAGLLFTKNEESVATYARQIVYYSYCSQPVEYKIGTIDKEFNLTTEELRQYTETAARIWNESYDKPLFVENPNAELSINLIYDERQRLLVDIADKTNAVGSEESNIKYESAQYEADYAALEKRVQELNNEIQYWNDQGGAPRETYQKLIDEQNDVNMAIDELNRKAEELNLEIAKFNRNVTEVNTTIEDYNQVLEQKPEGGLYMPQENRIEIYIYDNDDALIHVLSHELGHALGLEHVSGEGSIMNPIISEDIELTSSDKALLNSFCQERSKVDYIINEAVTVIENL